MGADFACGAKTQMGFRGTVSLNQVQDSALPWGNMLKGIRGQSSLDFYKFDFKKLTWNYLFSGILWYFLNF